MFNFSRRHGGLPNLAMQNRQNLFEFLVVKQKQNRGTNDQANYSGTETLQENTPNFIQWKYYGKKTQTQKSAIAHNHGSAKTMIKSLHNRFSKTFEITLKDKPMQNGVYDHADAISQS